MIRAILNAIRQHIASRRLAKLVEANRRSFEVEQYRRKRRAALKVSRKVAVSYEGS